MAGKWPQQRWEGLKKNLTFTVWPAGAAVNGGRKHTHTDVSAKFVPSIGLNLSTFK